MTLPLSCANCLEILEPQLPRALTACVGIAILLLSFSHGVAHGSRTFFFTVLHEEPFDFRLRAISKFFHPLSLCRNY